MALSPSASYKSHYQHFTPPFEIPESWKWVSLPEVCRIPITDGTHKTPIYSDKENGVPFLSSKDVTTRQINWDNIKFIDRKLHEELYSRLAPKRYDILLAKNGTTGVAAMVDTDAVFDIYVTLALIRPMIPFVYPKYLLYVINSDLCKAQFNAHLTGIGLPNLHLSDINKTIIPLPPIEEQIKIANEIDIWFSSVNMLEQNKEKLYVNITLAKSKILDLAMQGKLVPQDPADEPAADMLRRINPEAKIITDNPHYPQLPDNWVLVPLEDITEYEQPQPYIVQDTFYSDTYTIPVLTAGKSFILGYTNEDFGVYENVPAIIFDDFTTDSKLVEFHFKVKSSAMKIIQVKRGLSIEYVAMFMSTTRLIGETHKRYWISEYSKILIPIPPLEEQNRIVEKVNSIYCELVKIISALSE